MAWRTLFIVGMFLGLVVSPAWSAEDATALRVTSFNIRLAVANPKAPEEPWKVRQPMVLQVIHGFDPDLLGMQEVLPEQLADLTKALPDYQALSVGRDDGQKKGEAGPIFFKKDRFDLLEHGHFFLSETPEKAGVAGWDAALPRLAVWASLYDRITRMPVLFVNTHLDHKGEKARHEAAKLIRQRIPALAGGNEGTSRLFPVVLTGDFNATPSQPPYAALTEGKADDAWKLLDSYRQVHPKQSDEERTFGGFKGDRKGARIDWILHTSDLVATDARIDYFNVDGRYPSDHYPVHAVLTPAKKPQPAEDAEAE